MSDLQRVTKLGALLVERRSAMEKAEAELAELKAEVTRLEREDLPDLMKEIGLTEIKLTSGQVITIKEDCDARITEANRPAAFEWLLGNGFGGLIKTFVSVQFGKGEHDQASKAAETLRSKFRDHEVALEELVYSSTLKAFVKERMAAGEPVPADLFGVFPYSKAVIKG